MNEVWKFDQGQNLPATHKGVCMQLVAYWVSLMHYKKSDNVNAAADMVSLCKAEAIRLQKFYTKASGDLDTGADEAVTWNLRKLKLRDGTYTTCADSTAIVSFMDAKRQGYSMGIYFSGGGGHALGFWRSGKAGSKFSGHTYFFDPNYGCYKGDTSEYRSWLTTFLSTNYSTTNKMEMAKVDEKAAKPTTGAFSYT
jgi:hypothetical protein